MERPASLLVITLGTLGTLALCSTGANAAVAPPAAFAPPPGFTIDEAASRAFDYDHQTMSYKRPGTNESVPIDPAGRTWRLGFRIAPASKTGEATDAIVRAALTAQGWELLTPSGTLVARKKDAGAGAGRVLWWQGSAEAGYYRVVLVEEGGAPHVLSVVAPAATPESIADKDDFPYLGLFPGATLLRTEVQKTEMFDASPSGAKERTLVGAPLVRKRYRLAATTSPFELMVAYRDALEKTGWTIIHAAAGGDMSVIAHYAKNGRDLYCSVHGDAIAVADVGAENDAKKLQEALARDGHVAIYGIYFDVDKATLKAESETALRHVLALLQQSAALALEVQGHTDDTGTAEHNRTLSNERAASVKKWLVEHGVDGARLAPKGFGATKPVADNKTPEGRAKNRRVELAKR